MFFLMLLLAGTASMKGQEIPDGPKMVVTGNMVNTGALNAAIPIDLRTNAAGVGQIDNIADGDIKTPALNVSAGTLLNNEADLCVGCKPPKPCVGAIIYNAAWDYVENNLPGDGANAGGADDSTDQTWSPNITTTGAWSVGANLLDSEFRPTSIKLCVHPTNSAANTTTNWVNAVNYCANGTYADGDATAGWYFPNQRELQSIYEALGGSGSYGLAFSNLDPSKGTVTPNTTMNNMANGRHWSSTEYSNSEGLAFVFSSGNRSANDKTTGNYVRCVRRL